MRVGVRHPKACFNNVLFGINLNQNMPYIALFLEKVVKILGVLKFRPLSHTHPRVITHTLQNFQSVQF